MEKHCFLKGKLLLSTPFRQRLISWGPLTRRQKYKAEVPYETSAFSLWDSSWETPTPQEMRTAFHGWRLRSKRVDSLFPKPFRILKITQNHFSHN